MIFNDSHKWSMVFIGFQWFSWIYEDIGFVWSFFENQGQCRTAFCGLLAPSGPPLRPSGPLCGPKPSGPLSAAFWPPRRPGGVKRRYGSPPSNSPQHSGSVSVVGVVRIVLTRRRGSADMKKRKSVEIHEHRYSKQVQKAVDIDRNL